MSLSNRDCSILSAFAADFMLSGITCVPNLLLKYYKKIPLSDGELVLLIQLFRFVQEEKKLYPSPEELSEFINQNPAEIKKSLKLLQQKNLLKTVYSQTESQTQPSYNFEKLLDVLVEYWVLDRSEQEKQVITTQETENQQNSLSVLYKHFQQEFMRALTPNEIERVGKWVDQVGVALVEEALSRASLAGTKNFRYIDSIILDWQKRDFRSVAEVEENDRQYRKKIEESKFLTLRGSKIARSAKTESSNQQEEKKNREKEERIRMLQSLYIN